MINNNDKLEWILIVTNPFFIFIILPAYLFIRIYEISHVSSWWNYFFKMSGYRDEVLTKIIELNKIHQKRKSMNRLMLWHWSLADKKASRILSLRAKYDG